MSAPTDDRSLLDASVRLAPHVVHRDFVEETVILNLQSGQYHGLNRSAGRMLELLEGGASPRRTAATLADEHGLPRSQVEADVLRFCADLDARGLVVVQAGP